MFLVLLTALRTEWLAQLQAAHAEAAIRCGGPRPFIALVKMDKRFPLQIGFDFNLGELRAALERTRPSLAACAVIVTFGGVLGFTMHQALRLIGFAAQRSPPMQVCSTAMEAVCWIEPHVVASTAGPFDPVYMLETLRTIEVLLGAES